MKGVAAAEVELRVVALRGDGDGGISAGEGEHVRDGGVIRGIADGHVLEDGVGDVGAALVPLDDEGRAGRDGLGGVEVQRQRAAGEAARRGVERHGLHIVATERAAGRRHVEGQAEGVPRAVLVERATYELNGEASRSVVGGYDVGVLASFELSTVIIEQNQRIPPVGRYSDGLHIGLVPDVGCGEVVAWLLYRVFFDARIIYHPVVEHLAEGGGEAAGGQGVELALGGDVAGHRAAATVGNEHDSMVQFNDLELEGLRATPVARALDGGIVELADNVRIGRLHVEAIVRANYQLRIAIPHLHVSFQRIVHAVAVVVCLHPLNLAVGDVEGRDAELPGVRAHVAAHASDGDGGGDHLRGAARVVGYGEGVVSALGQHGLAVLHHDGGRDGGLTGIVEIGNILRIIEIVQADGGVGHLLDAGRSDIHLLVGHDEGVGLSVERDVRAVLALHVDGVLAGAVDDFHLHSLAGVGPIDLVAVADIVAAEDGVVVVVAVLQSPLRVERHDAAVLSGQVLHQSLVLVVGAAAVGLGVPAQPLASSGREGVLGQRRGLLVVGEGLVGHRAIDGDDGLKVYAVGVGRPLGVERQGGVRLGGEVQHLLAVRVGRAAAVGLGVPAGEVVARAGVGAGGQGLGLVVVEEFVVHRAARRAVAVEGDGVAVGRPLGPQLHVARRAGGDGGHGIAAAVSTGVPAAELVARPGGCAEGDGCALDGVGRGVVAVVGAAAEIVGDGVLRGSPLGPQLHVARRAAGDGGHLVARQAAVGVPAAEGVARAGGCAEGDGRALDGVGRGVAAGVGTAAEVVGDGVVDRRARHRHAGVGADVERVAADGRAVHAVGVVPARGGGSEGDGSGVVARAAVSEGGRGAGGDAAGEGQGVDAASGDGQVKAIPSYGTDAACRVVVAVSDLAQSTAIDGSAYRSFVTCVERGIDDVAVHYRAGPYRADDATGSFVTRAAERAREAGIDHRDIPDAAALHIAEQCGVS